MYKCCLSSRIIFVSSKDKIDDASLVTSVPRVKAYIGGGGFDLMSYVNQ